MRAVVYFCAVVLGTVLMSFEMIASRFLTPYFGSGITTWAALISMVLLAMTIGYFAGGFLIDRFPTLRLAALFSGIAAAWFLMVPLVSGALLESIMLGVEDEVLGVLIASSALLLIPVTALGTFSPIAVRLLILDIASSGRTAGTIYGASTMGNILGTLGTALFIIPNIGSKSSTYGLAVICAVCSLILWTAAAKHAAVTKAQRRKC